MITEYLIKSRKQHKLTMKETANMLGVSLSAYQKYENGTRDVSTAILSKLADLFNVTTDYLLGRNVEEPNDFEQLARRVGMSETERAVFERYFTLPQDLRGGFMDCLIKMTDISG